MNRPLNMEEKILARDLARGYLVGRVARTMAFHSILLAIPFYFGRHTHVWWSYAMLTFIWLLNGTAAHIKINRYLAIHKGVLEKIKELK